MIKDLKLLNKILKDKTGKDICPCCHNKKEQLIHVGLSLYVCAECMSNKEEKVNRMLEAEKTIRESLPESMANAALGRKL